MPAFIHRQMIDICHYVLKPVMTMSITHFPISCQYWERSVIQRMTIINCIPNPPAAQAGGVPIKS